MIRSRLAGTAQRAFSMIARGTLVKADDSKKWQEVTIRSEVKRQFTNVEVVHPYGYTAVPLPPQNDSASDAAEAIVVYLDGDMSHPMVLAIGDRRYRLKGLKDGEVALYDDQGQKIHLTRDGMTVHSPKPITVKSDEKITFEAPMVVVASGDIRLGGEGASRPLSAQDTVTSDGAHDSGNFLTSVKGL